MSPPPLLPLPSSYSYTDVKRKAEFMFKSKPKLAKQFDQVEKDRIPFAVLVAPEELKQGLVRVKQQGLGKEEGEKQGQGILMPLGEVVDYLRKKLGNE